jgi:hypothetical protein
VVRRYKKPGQFKFDQTFSNVVLRPTLLQVKELGVSVPSNNEAVRLLSQRGFVPTMSLQHMCKVGLIRDLDVLASLVHVKKLMRIPAT